ncbi:MAG: protein phosphatase 2C domain-containing protein, partial [Streptomyces sp.]
LSVPPGEPVPPLMPPPEPRQEPEPFRVCATVAQRGDTLLLCSPGLAAPLRGEPGFAQQLARSWAEKAEPPGLAAFLADVQLRVRGYADDRTAVAVWEG